MLFLYYVIHDRKPAVSTIESVHAVWVPNEVWRGFLQSTLKRHRIAFDPYTLR